MVFTLPAPKATGFTQVDSLRSTFRSRVNQFLTRYNLQTVTGRSSITAGTPARVSRPGFGLILGQVLLVPFSSNVPTGPRPGTPLGGPTRRGFAVKVG